MKTLKEIDRILFYLLIGLLLVLQKIEILKKSKYSFTTITTLQ